MSITRKEIAAISLFTLILIVLPLTILSLQKQSDPRSRAQFAINLLAPTNESKVSGTSVTVAAQANIELGHHGMEFYLDGVSIGQDDTAPYLIQWDSTTALNGRHTIVAKEINEFEPNNQRTSEQISIIVENNPSDKTAAAINAVEIETIQDSFASVSWETTDKTTSQILYGKTDDQLKASPQNSILTDDHTVALTNLEPNTEYTYQIKTIDAAGNTTMTEPDSFVTAGDNNATTGEWEAVSGWNFPTVHATLLYTGEVLLWSWNPAKDGTKLYNPTTNTFTNISISNNIFCAGHATLPDGRIFAAGGHISNNVGTKNTNIFDPATKKWTAGPMMRDGRWYPTVTVLPDGRTVIMTGDATKDRLATIPEVYNPETNSLTALTNIQTSTLAAYSATFPLQNNKVAAISYGNADIHILDADARTWTYKGKAFNNGGATAQFRPGKILMSGGRSGSTSDTKTTIIDLNGSNPVLRTVEAMQYGRYYHNLVNLPDGKVLAVGGMTSGSVGPLANEIWDPLTEQWTTVAPLSVKRMYHSTAVLLPDGRVLASGGRNGSGENYDAEIYSPPYLFKGARPSISSAPAAINSGTTITIESPESANISQVNLLTPASQTHTHDMSQRFIPLSFTKTANGLRVQIPDDTAVLPNGYYMLFIVNSAGIPSVSKMIKITDDPMPTASPTPLPTKTPTPIPTVTKAPTPTKAIPPTITPPATVQPTLRPTGIQTGVPTATKAPFETSIELNVYLHGIGKGGDNTNINSGGNANPIRKQRMAEVTMYTTTRQVAATISAVLIYNPLLGSYQGSALISNVPTEYYQFTIRSDGYLRKSIPGAQNILRMGQNVLPALALVAGDTNNDNKVSVLDYNRILDCFSDLNIARNCSTDKKLATDINDDAQVNQFDYNLFLRELAVQAGE